MQRLHNLQSQINRCNLNPTAYDEETASWNFELILSCNNSLLEEAWPKLSTKEKEDIAKLKIAMETFLNKYPIYEKSKRNSPLRINDIHWEIFKSWLFKYSLNIRELLDKHRLSSPDEDDEGL